MLTRSGKKITEKVHQYGLREREAVEVFFIEGSSYEDCIGHPELPVCGVVYEGWLCLSVTFDEQVSDSLVKCVAKFVEALAEVVK